MPHVVVYTKPGCPYCVSAKALLDSKGVRYEEIDVTERPDVRPEMERRSGQRTVPQIFVDGRHVGNSDEIHALDRRGELDAILGIAPKRGGDGVNRRRLIILGSGPAGLTAALYAARANLEPLVLAGGGSAESLPGGQLMTTTDVENYPGFPGGVEGPALMDLFRRQAERFGATCVNADAVACDLSRRPFAVEASDGARYACDALVVATGASAKYLGLPSEQAYRNKGVSACATCDGALFRGERIGVVGGGDTAMEEALFLTRFAERVFVIHRRDAFRASRIMRDRVLDHPKIEVRWNRVVDEVLGDGEKVTGVRLKDAKGGGTEDLPLGALFIAIGHTPNTAFLKGQLKTDEQGYVIPADGNTKTEIPGVFVAGDVRDKVYRQAVTAAGMGCMAALEAERFLSSIE